MHTRIEQLRVLYAACEMQMPFNDFARSFADYDLMPIEYDNKLVGTILTKDNDIHVGVLPTARGKWFRKWVFRDVLNPIVKKYGCAVTTVRKSNLCGQAFVERIGFKRKGETQEVYKYVLSALRSVS